MNYLKLFFIFITSIILFFGSLNILFLKFFNNTYFEDKIKINNTNNLQIQENEDLEHTDENETMFYLPIDVENKLSIQEQISKNLDLGFILYFVSNGDEYNGSLPNDITKNQIRYRYELADDIEFLVFNQHSLNVNIIRQLAEADGGADQKLDGSGIFVRRSLNEGWKYFLKINNNTQQKNNVYDFWSDNGVDLFVLIVDSNSVGSGEGVAKVLKSNNGGKNWQIEKCFYYVPEFQNSVDKLKSNLTDVVNNYIKQNPKYLYKNNNSKCQVKIVL